MRSYRAAVVLLVTVAAGLVGIGSASASVAPSSGHAVVKATGDEGPDGSELMSPYEDTRDMAQIFKTHRLEN